MIRWSAHLGTLFTELPLPQRFGAAAAAGFARAECWSPFAEDLGELEQAVRASRLELAGFNLEAGDMAAGERGYLNLPERRRAVLENAAEALALAERLSVPVINCLVGNDSGAPREAQLDEVAQRLREIADRAEGSGMMLVVEALNPRESPAYLLHDVDQAAALVDRVERPNVGLLFDVYHAAAAGRDVGADYSRHHRRIAHIQLADHPGRHEPGSGTLDFESLLEAVVASGYEGAVGLEYLPRESTEASLAWLPRDQRAGSRSFPAARRVA